MSIKEEAEEYARRMTGADDYVWGFVVKRAYEQGAKYMLDKACEYLKSQLPIHYVEYAALAEESVRQFRKKMEE